MDKIYYLSSCDSCKRILKELAPIGDTVLIDIKTHPLTTAQLEEMRQMAGSYEALFSKRARLYRERGLNKQHLSEEHFRALILEHYTFLKRPVMIFGEKIYIGNSAKVVAVAKETLHA